MSQGGGGGGVALVDLSRVYMMLYTWSFLRWFYFRESVPAKISTKINGYL